MICIKNAFPKKIFNDIKSEIESDSFSWFYTPTAYGTDSIKSFSHMVYDNDNSMSYIHDALNMFIRFGLENHNIDYENLFRIRIGLLTQSKNTIIHEPHVDFDKHHNTGLIYLNDSDGDTILYKQKYIISNMSSRQYKESIKLDIDKLITPEENKLVIFDGLTYHSSSTPQNSECRIVINFNYI